MTPPVQGKPSATTRAGGLTVVSGAANPSTRRAAERRLWWGRVDLAERPEPGADLVDEQLGLFPCREVPTLGEPVVIDQVRIGVLCPLPRHLVKLVGEHAHGH